MSLINTVENASEGGAITMPSRDPFLNDVIVNKLVTYISPYDLNCCRQVCREWRERFSATSSFTERFQLTINLRSLKILAQKLKSLYSFNPSSSTILFTRPLWATIIFHAEDYAPEDEEIKKILDQLQFARLKNVTIEGYNSMYKTIFKKICNVSQDLSSLSVDWNLLTREHFMLPQAKLFPIFPKLTKLILTSVCKRIPSGKSDGILSQNLNSIFLNVSHLQSLSLKRGFTTFEKMSATIKALDNILDRNSKTIGHLVVDDLFLDLILRRPFLEQLSSFEVTVSDWSLQREQIRVYLSQLVRPLRELHLRTPANNNHQPLNVHDISQYGQALEKLTVFARLDDETFVDSVHYLRNFSQLKELYFYGENSIVHVLLSSFIPGDELILCLPIHLEKLYLRGFGIRQTIKLAQLDCLTELCLNECKVKWDSFITSILKNEGGLVRLKTLELWDYHKANGPTDYEFTGYNNNSENHYPSVAVDEQWNIRNLKDLRKLTLRRFENITDDICYYGIMHLPRLEYLDLGFCERITQHGIEAVTNNCPYLSELHVSKDLDLSNIDFSNFNSRLGRSIRLHTVSNAPVLIANFLHNLIERFSEITTTL